eukprot:Nitzschia sp. Nitz4//scaffold10_size219509//76349//77992//NITZ4_001420-RA/size219509-processed-gene-0.69-mRNA-1//1//CDS//3329532896//2251//frame0
MAEESHAPEEDDGDTNVIDDIFPLITYRPATPTDILQCYELEKESYPPEQAASKNDLRYRQHHAAAFFRCAVLQHEDINTDEDIVIGYICSTRCEPSEDDSYSTTNEPDVSTLVVHSMVIRDEYQHQGVGKHMMLNYIASIQAFNATCEHPVRRIVAYVREKLLPLFLNCGYSALRPSRCSSTPKGVQQPPRYFMELKLETPYPIDTKSLRTHGGFECFIVDSFASAPGTGNPAAVVMMPEGTDPEFMAKWMQTVAAEFNLSETAFCWPATAADAQPADNDDEHWNIRYYSPKAEVALCGHATLASAAVLFRTLRRKDLFRIVFHASEDDLTMERNDIESSGGPSTFRVTMALPSKPPRELETTEEKLTVRTMLEAAFNCHLDPLYVGVSDTGDILMEVKPESFSEIGYEKINFKALVEWDGYFRGVIVCCTCENKAVEDGEEQSNARPDFLSRFFGPKVGINEDPVTGSAHCALGPYYSQKLGKELVFGKQMSKRQGTVECLVKDGQVLLTGTAIITVMGTLLMRKGETLLVQRVTRERSSSVFDG